MKLALITDTHWGVRNDNVAFMDNSKKFLADIFFPYLVENKITTVIHLGDIVDRRKYINFVTAGRLRTDFLEPLQAMGIKLHIIAGNHDVYYKNTNSVNALYELIENKYDNVTIFTKTEGYTHDGRDILYVPWINDENRKETLEKINDTNAQIIMGHLELAGFQMYKGSMASHGDDSSLFDRFDIVMSGHFHHRSTNGNIFYLGSHAEFTWSDWNDPKGFHIFDTKTQELEFIENPYTMFDKFWYDDVTAGSDPEAYDLNCWAGKFVKVIVKNKSDPYRFDKFMDKMHKVALDVQIVEDHLNLNIEEDGDIVNEAESTQDIFNLYIDQINAPNLNKKRLQATVVDLYNEALAIE